MRGRVLKEWRRSRGILDKGNRKGMLVKETGKMEGKWTCRGGKSER